jgi:hypothetical protein
VVIGKQNVRRIVWSACCLALGMFAGCSSSKNMPPATLTFVSPTASPTLDLGESVNLTVSQSASWTLQSGCLNGKPSGTFAGGGLTATGATATYVAPSPQASPACSQDVVVANASNQSATLTVLLAPLVSIANAGSYTYTGAGCSNGGTCCPASGTLILPATSNASPIMQVGTLAQLGSITVAGGVPPYTWQVTSGSNSVPQGLQLTEGSDSSETLLSGTPITAGCSSFTLQVNDSTAGSSCNPQSSSACSQASFNVVVLPSAPKVQLPSYPSALNDPQNGDKGAAYAPVAMVASGGQPPYFFCQSPSAGLSSGGVLPTTLPTGLTLNSKQASAFTCPATVSSTGVAVIAGTPASGEELGGNQNAYCTGQGAGPGCFTTQFQIYDSQTPYPAASFVNLVNMQALPLIACSQANQAPALNQGALNPDAYLAGPVAFLLRGFDANGPVVMVGSVTLDGSGNTTGGTVDVTRSTGHSQFSIETSGSWYSVGTAVYGVGDFEVGPANLFDYSRGCMNLALSGSGGPATPISFTFSLGGCSNNYSPSQEISTSAAACGVDTNNEPLGVFTSGRIIGFDDSNGSGTRATGILRSQNSSTFATGLSGPYAFGLSGGDSVQQHFAMAGSLQANSGTFGAVAADVDDGGACASSTCNVNTTGGSGTYTIDPTFGSSNGRWSGALSLSGQTSFGLAVYTVSANEALVATTDQLAVGHPVIGGEAITTASTFNAGSLQNSHIFHIGGLSAVGPDVSVGLLSFDGQGTVTGTVYEDQAATLGTTAASGVYQVDSNTGRTLFTAPNTGQTLGAHNFVAYVIPAASTLTRSNCGTPAACVTGFLVGTDSTAQSGLLEFQISTNAPPPPFVNLYVAGNYDFGTDEILDSITPDTEGDVWAAPKSTSTTGGNLGSGNSGSIVQDLLESPFVQDTNYGDKSYFCTVSSSCYLLQPNQQLTGNYSINTNGTGTFGGGTVSVSNGSVIFYIDESPANSHPSVMVAEQ